MSVNTVDVIERLKQLNNVRTSEDVFGINKPAEYQCPNIDNIIEHLNYGLKYINDIYKADNLDEVVDLAKDVEYEIGDLEQELEELRDAIDKVRIWGQGWKNEFKWLLNQLTDEQLKDMYELE